MSFDDLSSWLELYAVPGIGPATFVKLVHYFGSPINVLQASTQNLEHAGLASELIRQICLRTTPPNLKKELDYIKAFSITVIPYTSSEYPAILREIPSFPPLLFVQGKLAFSQVKDWIAIVGSRHPTDYGLKMTRKLARELVAHRIGIISGFALGVDIAAHLAAVDASGWTIGVIGSGLAHISPYSNKRYIHELCQSGSLISEFSPHVPVTPGCFPRRNRIISGLARGVLVIEAGSKSGALITANYALEQNRDLFAVPGPADSVFSEGTNLLIKKGAKLVSCVEDVLDEWNYQKQMQSCYNPAHPIEAKIYSLCQTGAFSTDQIIEQLTLTPEIAMVHLTKLEMDGKLKSLGGGRYQAI